MPVSMNKDIVNISEDRGWNKVPNFRYHTQTFGKPQINMVNMSFPIKIFVNKYS